ncbi:glycosyltransferase [Ancylomarina sp. DW003]|nr:glycosyltransferase [Ancylomarina sp. DW003]MDE5423407.1 glycosyltransferase [Ancylomarina sp. DW003]
MRILQLIDNLSPGGAERMAVNIANVLYEAKNESFLCVTRNTGGLSKHILNGIQTLFLNKKGMLDIRALFRLLRFVYKNEIDIIHAHSSSIFFGGLIKIFKPGVKLIWHDHFGNRENDSRRNLFYILFSLLFDRVIVVNHSLEIWAKKHLLLSDKKIVYLKNFPHLNLNIDHEEQTNAVQIIYLANLKKPKNHQLLVESINKLQSKLINVNLSVSLVGAYTNDSYYKSLVSLIEEYDLKSVFNFIGSVSDPSKYLLNADIAVICSTFEGLPVSLLEYGLAELPVISTSVGQCPEVLDYGKSGWVVESENTDAFSKTLLHVISDSDDAKVKALNLKKRVLNKYGANSFLDQYLKLVI